MKAEKKKLAELTLCYCVAPLFMDGKQRFLVASEKEHECLLFNEQGALLDEVWKGPGGTMSMVQLPGSNGAFLATHRFYSPNNCKEASIVACWPENGGWSVRTLALLPGVHRFDILERGGVHYLLACTIKSDYEEKDDWRFPGKVYAAVLPEDILQKPADWRLEPVPIAEGLLKNHGYSRDVENGVQTGIVTAEQGVFRFTPPAAVGEAWTVEQLLDAPVSDALLLDFDGDGEKELLTLSPFHGDTLRVYHKQDGRFVPVFTYEEKIPFAHAICAAKRNGKPIAVVGHRKERRDLLALDYADGAYRVTVLDHDVGPANAMYLPVSGRDVVIAANRETNEIAYYTLED